MTKILFSLLASGLVLSVSAQQSISLEDAVEKTRLHNLTIQSKVAEIERSQKQSQLANAVYMPYVNLSYSVSRTNDPLHVFGAKLKQERVTASDFVPQTLNHPQAVTNYNAKASIVQPIINLAYFSQRNAAKAQLEAIRHQLTYTEHALVFETRKSYTQLQMLYAVRNVLAQAKETALANRQRIQNRTSQGLAKNVDVLSAEVQLTQVENKIIENENQLRHLSDYLSYMMGEDAGEIWVPEETLPLVQPIADDSPMNGQRSDFLAYEQQLNATKAMVNMYRNQFFPTLNAFGSYEFNDRNFGLGTDNYMVGLQLSWDIFRGNQLRKQKEIAQITLKERELAYQQYKRQSAVEYHQALRNITYNAKRWELAQKAASQSQERLRIRQNRFNEGLENTTDLLADQSQWMEKEFERLQARLEWQISQYYVLYINNLSISK
ncbi:MAG: TolC family protein [Capnocytophaga sp.]|nr:TolC family protein [Capnocytophaga sp.]